MSAGAVPLDLTERVYLETKPSSLAEGGPGAVPREGGGLTDAVLTVGGAMGIIHCHLLLALNQNDA